MNRPDLLHDERMSTKAARRKSSELVNRTVSDWTRQYTKAELTERLGGVLPFGPVNDAADIMADPHIAVRGMIAALAQASESDRPWKVAANPVHFTGTPAPRLKPAPALGEANAELIARGAIRDW